MRNEQITRDDIVKIIDDFYGSKLEDIQEINRLKDENLELKLIIGEMQHQIFKLHKELDEKD